MANRVRSLLQRSDKRLDFLLPPLRHRRDQPITASPRLGLAWHAASSLYIWGILLALTASLGGALAWTFASQRLPVAVSAQLIKMETVFGVVLGLLVRYRWPTVTEAAGMAVLLAGVVITIRISHGRPARAGYT